MFDNLRDQASSSPFSEEEAKFQPAAEAPHVRPGQSPGRFLGMTAFQRFTLAMMIMLIVCVLGIMVLLVTGKLVF